MKVSSILFFTALFTASLAISPAHADMQEDIDRAVSIIERFSEIPESAIPPAVMRDAKGVAILTVTKAGFVLSGRGGTGVVAARTEKGWSGPSAIGTGGIGLGFQIGLQVSEYVIILNTQEAVNSFAKGSNITLGGNLSAAIGPVGRSAEAAIAPQAAIYTYSRSQGIFAGVSLEGTVIATRYEANEQYYGKPTFPSDILSGDVKPPASAQKLIDVLSKY
ncbi:MAG TPA: lipid-binding SYLF domain-containing protein [Candidatus Binatia bacterium]|nr:lipid-binding SYLF domain-containing protein [Candidatus Binatia bacterium]